MKHFVSGKKITNNTVLFLQNKQQWEKNPTILLAGVIAMKCNSNIYLECCKMHNCNINNFQKGVLCGNTLKQKSILASIKRSNYDICQKKYMCFNELLMQVPITIVSGETISFKSWQSISNCTLPFLVSPNLIYSNKKHLEIIRCQITLIIYLVTKIQSLKSNIIVLLMKPVMCLHI